MCNTWYHLQCSKLSGYGYMFINKIRMSQTCLYNTSYKKATKSLQQPVATEGIRLKFSITLTPNFATVHSQVTLGGCSVEYEYQLLWAFGCSSA